jgi:hypothetical protein
MYSLLAAQEARPTKGKPANEGGLVVHLRDSLTDLCCEERLVALVLEELAALRDGIVFAEPSAPLPEAENAKRGESVKLVCRAAVRHLEAHWNGIKDHLDYIAEIIGFVAGVDAPLTKEGCEIIKRALADNYGIADVALGNLINPGKIPGWMSNSAVKNVVNGGVAARSFTITLTSSTRKGITNAGTCDPADAFAGKRRGGPRDAGDLLASRDAISLRETNILRFSVWVTDEVKWVPISLGTAYWMDPSSGTAKQAIGDGFNLFGALASFDQNPKKGEKWEQLGKLARGILDWANTIKREDRVFALEAL